jgi:hypothetical protein
MTDTARAALAAAALAAAAAAGCQTAAPKPDSAEPEREEAPAPAASFEWTKPEGWKTETIPFPLEFAPEIRLQGVEELRFAPGMFKPDQPGYWSYAFAWWLDGEPALGQAELEQSLLAYFQGLTTAVGKEKGRKIDPGRFRVTVRPSSGAPAKEGHNVQAFSGTAELYDAFATGKPISLNMEIWVWDCPVAGKRVALVLASPRPTSEPIWKDLAQRRDELLCHRY